MEDARREMICSLTRKLLKDFKGKPINSTMLENLYREKRYPKMISEIKNHMSIDCKLSVKCITSAPLPGYENTPAWIKLPRYFPAYKSPAQRNMKLTMFYYKAEMDSYYKFVMLISHELAHLFLSSVNHSLRGSEEATDICAIVLGFGRFYELGQTTFNSNGRTRLGYLSIDEIIYVLSIVEGENPTATPPSKKVNWFSKLFGNL